MKFEYAIVKYGCIIFKNKKKVIAFAKCYRFSDTLYIQTFKHMVFPKNVLERLILKTKTNRRQQTVFPLSIIEVYRNM